MRFGLELDGRARTEHDRTTDKTIARTAQAGTPSSCSDDTQERKAKKRSIIENRIKINREAHVRVFCRAIVIACGITIDRYANDR